MTYEYHGGAICVGDAVKNMKPQSGRKRITLIILGSNVGTVQLMLLNLLQGVVIMADKSLCETQSPEEASLQDLCGLSSARMSNAGVSRSLSETGTGKSSVRIRTKWPPFEMPGRGPEMSSGDFIRIVPKGRRSIHSQMTGRKPWKTRKEGLLPQLAHEPNPVEPSCCSERCPCGKPAAARGEMQHERGAFCTRTTGSGNSNRQFLLGLLYVLTSEVLSPQSCGLTRHLLDFIQGLLETSCVLYLFK